VEFPKPDEFPNEDELPKEDPWFPCGVEPNWLAGVPGEDCPLVLPNWAAGMPAPVSGLGGGRSFIGS